jgi:oligoendopeptidase F
MWLLNCADIDHTRTRLKNALRTADQFATRYAGRIRGLDGRELAEAFEQYEACVAAVQRLSALAELAMSSGYGVDGPAATLSLCDRGWAALARRLGFFETELAQLTAAEAEELAILRPGGVYHNFYRQVVAAEAGISPDTSAALAALQPTGIAGWQALARQLLGRIEVVDTDEVTNLGSALAKLYRPNREVRRRTHAAVTRALAPELELRATALSMIVADGVARAELCGTDWLHDSLRSDQLVQADLDALISCAVAAYPLAHQYFALKRQLIGAGSLLDYDRYAPVVADEPLLTWQEAVDIVVATFQDVHPSFGDAARRLISVGHVDGCSRAGKAATAFAKEVPGDEPYIAVNFSGTFRSVLSLAHEMGHGVHMMASQRLPLLAAATPRVLAETVALFFESVTLRAMFRNRSVPEERLSLSARAVEDRLVSICRHAALYKFESELRSEHARGTALDAGLIGELWLTTQREFYGEAMDLTDDCKSWWSGSEALFLTPGSTYSYLYGQLAAVVLVAQYEADPVGTGQRLVQLTSAGGSVPLHELLQQVGADCLDPRIQDSALRMLESTLSDLRVCV